MSSVKDVELVIKISEKVYNALTHTEFEASLVVNEMRESIANGTPLPKGHGRLIDREEISVDVYEDADGFHYEVSAPTVIEADKAESEDKE